MIVKAIEQLEPRFKVFVYVACLGEEENAFELFRFVPQVHEKTLVEANQELLSIPKKERNRFIAKELRQLIETQKVHPLGEIHPGWFLEVLKGESPRTVGFIMRYLPGDKVKYILDHLSPEVSARLPKMNESFKIPEELIEVIRTRFESQFSTLISPKKTEEITLDHLYFIKTDPLLLFFRDLGLEQLARAFKGIHKTALKALLTRLSIKDAKELQIKVKAIDRLSVRALQEAQMLLLNLPIETIDPENLFLEVGIAFFAKAITKEESEFVRALQFKLPPRFGYLLKRYVDGSLMSNKPNVVQWAKKQILERFQSFQMD
jgi:hypothetical protein